MLILLIRKTINTSSLCIIAGCPLIVLHLSTTFDDACANMADIVPCCPRHSPSRMRSNPEGHEAWAVSERIKPVNLT